jgi:hypothetical protein
VLTSMNGIASERDRTPPGDDPAASRLATLERYLAAGYTLIPVVVRGKKPVLEAWSHTDVAPDELRRMFTETPYNIGVRLGDPSRGLVDVDIDCAEALAVADAFLPQTGAVFGRLSKPRSHRLYRSAMTTEKFQDPTGPRDSAMLLELRSTGGQTVLPGSTHESGEPIEWSRPGLSTVPEAVTVESGLLERAVALTATTALLGRHYPGKGARHDYELGLAGGLLRIGVEPEDAVKMLDGIATVAGVTPDGTAYGKVHDTRAKIADDKPATGWKTVVESLGDTPDARTIVNQVIRWLAVKAPVVRLDKDDFYAYLPSHKYIFRPTGAMWEPAGVNGNMGRIADGFDTDGNPILRKASEWLDLHRPVHQITWLPGEPEYIEDLLVDEGGVTPHPGMRAYNEYRAPHQVEGDPGRAGPWVEHVRRLYLEEAEHIIAWLAHRVQRPGEKINHALVLGDAPGIGKDTIFEPVVRAAGAGNCGEASPAQIMERFNEFLQSVILRISEARDVGEANRYGFYERTKTIIASPPETLRIDRKFVGTYRIPNVAGVIFTTNNRLNGLYLPPDDRRHFVAWSEALPAEFSQDYFTGLYDWYFVEGFGHVRAYLASYDLGGFDPKAPPKKTEAFWAMVATTAAPETVVLGDVLDALGEPQGDGEAIRPAAVTMEQLRRKAEDLGGYKLREGANDFTSLHEMLTSARDKKRVLHLLGELSYLHVSNPGARDGRWRVDGKRQGVYARSDLAPGDRQAAALALTKGTTP